MAFSSERSWSRGRGQWEITDVTLIDSSPDSRAPHAVQPGGVALEARDIRKTYGDVVALEGLSFVARAGEVLGVLGPNGAVRRRRSAS